MWVFPFLLDLSHKLAASDALIEKSGAETDCWHWRVERQWQPHLKRSFNLGLHESPEPGGFANDKSACVRR